MFKMFRLGCWQVDARGSQIKKTIWLNPKYVMGIEREDDYTVVHMTFGTFYTYSIPEVIQHGLNDIARMNSMIINFN